MVSAGHSAGRRWWRWIPSLAAVPSACPVPADPTLSAGLLQPLRAALHLLPSGMHICSSVGRGRRFLVQSDSQVTTFQCEEVMLSPC